MQDCRFDASRFISGSGRKLNYQNRLYERGANQSRTNTGKMTFQGEILGTTLSSRNDSGSSKGDQGIFERSTAHFTNDNLRLPSQFVDNSRNDFVVSRLIAQNTGSVASPFNGVYRRY